MGKLTSTIGIPIKLLNEAQVRTSKLYRAELLRMRKIFRDSSTFRIISAAC